MHDYLFLAVIASVLFIGAMSPGPSFLIVAKNALSQSRAHGIATALGTGLGVSLFAILASFGVTALIESVPQAYLLFKIIGGVYLLYIAYKIWRGADSPLATDGDTAVSSMSLFKAFCLGLITQLSNPKTALVIAGIFAAFVPSTPPPYTTLLVAVIAFIIDFSWYALVALSLSLERTRGAYQKAKGGFDRAAAIFLGAVGVRLLLSKLPLD